MIGSPANPEKDPSIRKSLAIFNLPERARSPRAARPPGQGGQSNPRASIHEQHAADGDRPRAANNVGVHGQRPAALRHA
jgi:hypothetical protein